MTGITPGFAEPIVWGLRQRYTPEEIAAGLEIDVAIVLRVKAILDLKERMNRPYRHVRFDPNRTDAAYLNWRRAAEGARDRLKSAEGWV